MNADTPPCNSPTFLDNNCSHSNSSCMRKQYGKNQIVSESQLSLSPSSSCSPQPESVFMLHYREWYLAYYGGELKIPKFNRKEMNLEDLWKAVMSRGGSQKTTTNKQWAEIGREFSPPKSMTNLSYHIKRLYEKYLLAYEKSVSPHTSMNWRHAPAVKQNPSSPKSSEGRSSGEPDVGNNPQSLPLQNNCKSAVVQKYNEFFAKVCSGDEQLVGSVIRLWLPQKKDSELVTVVNYNSHTQEHTVRSFEGATKTVKLRQHTWSLCPEDCDDQVSLGCWQSNQNNNNSVVPEKLGCCTEIELSNAETYKTQDGHSGHGFVIASKDWPTAMNSLQWELSKANERILELEARQKSHQQQQDAMRVQFCAREQQLRIMVGELTQKLREADEARQQAEGAVRELRTCFDLIFNGTGFPPNMNL